MAKHSIVVKIADGISNQYAISFTGGFMSRDHVTARVNEEVDGLGEPTYRPITWVNDGIVQVGGPLPLNGDAVEFRRITPIDQAVNDFQNGSVLLDRALDEGFEQAIKRLQEVEDTTSDLITIQEGLEQVNAAQDAVESVQDGVEAIEAGLTALFDEVEDAISSVVVHKTRNEAVTLTPGSVNHFSIETPQGILKYRADPNGTALTTSDGRKWSPTGVARPDHWRINENPGVTDMFPALQSALNYGVTTLFPTTYATEQTLQWTGRNSGFIAEASDYYPDAVQGGDAYNGSRILWTGPATTGAVLLMSKMAVGVERASAFDDSVFGGVLKGVLVDGANLADYGVYAYRLIGGTIAGVFATNTVKHGFYIDGAYNGEYSKLTAFRNRGCGITIGRGHLDFGWSAFGANALFPHDLWGYSNGWDGAYHHNTNPLWGYGVGFFGHRGNKLLGVRAENNDGVNIVFAPTSTGNSLEGVYSELGNSLILPSGSALDTGRADVKTGLLFHPSNSSAYGNVVRDGVLAGEYLRVAGTEPSLSKTSQPTTFENLSLVAGSVSDWSNWRSIDCDLTMHTNLTGVQPTAGGNINGAAPLTNFTQTVGTASFNVSTGSVVVTTNKGFASIVRVATGIYDLSFDDPQYDAVYFVGVNAYAGNRAVAVGPQTQTGFRILHQNLSGVLTDSSSSLTVIVYR